MHLQLEVQCPLCRSPEAERVSLDRFQCMLCEAEFTVEYAARVIRDRVAILREGPCSPASD